MPYGVFKVGGGLAAAQDFHPAFGGAFVLWGVADALLNLVSVVSPRRVSYCVLSNVGRLLDRSGSSTTEQLLLALDTLLSFSIVASMIWTARISTLPPLMVRLWELAVITNVLGVGVDRVWQSWRAHRGLRNASARARARSAARGDDPAAG
jgi:hypothetical protein